MKKELDEALCAKYPKLFRDRNAPMTVTCMCWGFDCGDGWYNIIDVLCSNIQHHIDHKRKDRARALVYNRALKRAISGDDTSMRRWYSYMSPVNLDEAIKKAVEEKQFRKVPDSVSQVVVSQVKEKFGGLRFYVNGGDREVYAMISMAESMSYRTCEVCGSPGKSNSHGWITTLCETHRNEKENQYA